MKKIIMAVAAIAMAASMFAADVSAKVALKGKLFDLQDSGNIGVLSGPQDDTHNWAPSVAFSVSGEKVGAEFKFDNNAFDEWGNETWKDDDPGLNGCRVDVNSTNIWFKPLDMLKITVGNYDYNLFQETIKWSKGDTGLGGAGYKVDFSMSGFELNASLNTNFGGGTNFLWIPKVGDALVMPFAIKAAYNADFGSVGAYLKYNAKKNMNIAAGYKGAFGGVAMFVNAIGHIGEKFDSIELEAFATGNVDSFGWGVFVQPTIFLGDGHADPTLYAFAKVWYGINGLTPYLLVISENQYEGKTSFLDKNGVQVTIQPGVTGNLGGMMGWEVSCRITTNQGNDKNVTVNIPFAINVGF